MPLIRVQISEPVSSPRRGPLMAQLSKATAEVLGKPESYVMVILESEVPMMMAGVDATTSPAAFFEVRSVGRISGDQARSLSARISEIIGKQTGLEAGRIYSNYSGLEGSMWGAGGQTFG